MTADPIIIKSLKPIGWQLAFVDSFESLKKDEKLFVVSGRQRGKSTILLQIILYVCINRPKSTSYFCSPTNNQNRSRFRDLSNMLGGHPLVSKLNESTFECRFINGSSVTFISAESGDNLRGNTCSNGGILIIDECAFIKDDVITSILTPYVTVHHANIVAVSTPRRKTGWFYEGVCDAKAGLPLYKYVDAGQYDSSFFITPEQIEDYRRKYTPEKFRNEIEGLFSDSGSGVFGDYQRHFQDVKGEPVYIGIDWSTTGTDSTVIVGFDSEGHMVLLWKDNATPDPIDRADKIVAILNNLKNPKQILVEQNSIGEVYYSYVKKRIRCASVFKKFNTSNNSKVRIIEQLVKDLNTNEITLLPHPDLDYQFGIFECVPLQKGKYTYAADTRVSDSHDDIVLATAFADEARHSTKNNYSLSVIG